jgi:hypothetical protein
MSSSTIDLLRLDRDVARASEAIAHFRTELRRVEGDVARPIADPLAPFQHVAGRTAYEALAAYHAGLAEEPIKAALLPWIHALVEARVGLEFEVSWVRETRALAGRVLLEAPRQTSYDEAWRGIVYAPDLRLRVVWLEAAAELAPRLAPIAREAKERRVEVGKRLGLGHSATEGVGEISSVGLREAARTLLAQTADLRAAMRRESAAHSSADTPHARLGAWVGEALSTDAPEGWPARLTQRWLEETFVEMSRGAHFAIELPRAVGAASFARALYRFGFSVREGGRGGLPFSVAHCPDQIDAHRIGFVFGALPLDRTFLRRVLGVGERIAARQARSLARTALLEAVWVAARWLLTSDSSNPTSMDWEEVTCDVFQGSIDARFAGSWPSRRGDEGPRLEALLGALPLANDLVLRFDQDWFRNPATAAWMRARAGGPARIPSQDPLDAVALASSLCRSFEQVLG